MKDVVSHEFFHIVTPLTIHSKEIHYFDYNSPKNVRTFMDVRRSNRIFCQSFQINQGLIPEEEFYSHAEKIENANE
jgi:hypothetical protein